MAGQTSKKKYEVYVTRTYVAGATVEVEAHNSKEAQRIALSLIGDLSLSIKSAVEDGDRAEVIGVR